jgi:hypothetical protein
MSTKYPNVETDLYNTLRTTGRTLVIVALITSIAGFIAIITAIVIVTVGKGKDKVVFVDVTGRPYLVRKDDPNKIHAPELEHFVKTVTPKVLEWDFAEIRSEQLIDGRVTRMQAFFDPDFLRSFIPPFLDIYLRSIRDQRAVVRLYIDNVHIKKIDGDRAIAVVSIDKRTIRAGVTGADGMVTTNKQYAIKVYKGGRGFDNPYGLYITYFSEHDGSRELTLN